MSQNEINIPVKVENIEELKNLLDKADKQTSDLRRTIHEIENCRLGIKVKINQ